MNHFKMQYLICINEHFNAIHQQLEFSKMMLHKYPLSCGTSTVSVLIRKYLQLDGTVSEHLGQCLQISFKNNLFQSVMNHFGLAFWLVQFSVTIQNNNLILNLTANKRGICQAGRSDDIGYICTNYISQVAYLWLSFKQTSLQARDGGAVKCKDKVCFFLNTRRMK